MFAEYELHEVDTLSPVFQNARTTLLSGHTLRAGCAGADSAYISPECGRRTADDLGIRDGNIEPLIEHLTLASHKLRAFEFGFYRHLGFLKDSEVGIFPDLSISVNGLKINVRYIGSGYFGSVFKVSSDTGKSYALKIFYRRATEYQHSGPWNETALGIYLSAQRVSNMPHLCLANPARGWILSEYVDQSYQSPSPDGPTYQALGLKVFDQERDKENQLLGAAGQPLRVDYGHLGLNISDQNQDEETVRKILTKYADPRGVVDSTSFLQYYREAPQAREYLLKFLARVPKNKRMTTLSEMLQYPEADYFTVQDYLAKGVIPADNTLLLFNLLMKNSDPYVRGQAIFDIRGLPKDDISIMGKIWSTQPEFTPFMVYLGQKKVEDNFLN